MVNGGLNDNETKIIFTLSCIIDIIPYGTKACISVCEYRNKYLITSSYIPLTNSILQ